jgi:hypothetical protein
MARVINNPLLRGVSGKLGDTHVYKRLPNGMVVMANAPAERSKISKKQKESSERFKKAAGYAKRQMADPEMKAEYKKGVTYNKSSAYRVALTDYMNAPVMHYIKAIGYTGAIGDLITIKATDDFRVTGVNVKIVSPKGIVLEKGSAQQNPRKRHMWNYRTTVVNAQVTGTKIQVVAMDMPENRTEMETLL